MNYLIAMIGAVMFLSIIAVILACIADIRNAPDVMEREQDDLEQAEYLREWKKAREQKEKPV